MDSKSDQICIREDPTAQKYFNPLTKGVTKNFIDDFLAEIKNLKIDSLLDVGCGTGYITKKLKIYPSTCIGCDIDMSRIKLAREYIGPDVPLVVANAIKLPFKSSTFNMVTAMELLEHVPDTEALLKEIKRVSKDYVLITVPNEPLFRLANFFRGKNVTRLGNPEDHIHHFNRKSLEFLLSKHFSEVKIKVNSFFWLMAICHI